MHRKLQASSKVDIPTWNFYNVNAQQCFVEAAHKGQLKGEAKAIRVPGGRNKLSPFTRKSVMSQSKTVFGLWGKLRGEVVDSCKQSCPNRSLPDCCFLEVGIVALFLPPDFNRIGSAACVSCQQLQTVDLSQTCIIEILGSTFACCSQLRRLGLPRGLRVVGQGAFLRCASLRGVCGLN